nr:DcaP family trimeric outer membrane transporter [uncultured Halomonas sp.]
MTIKKSLKHTALFSIGSLAMAVASASHGVDFEVGDTKASVYGYAKLDIIYDVDAELGNAIRHGNIALDGQPSKDGNFDMHAYQSRIGFKTVTPVSGSDLVTQIEGDFYGEGGGEFRLRHAYGSWNGILAGQYWTNFYGFVAGTPTIDFTGPPGVGNQARQPQLRYTAGNFSMAIEDPDTLGGSEDADLGTTEKPDDIAKSQLPDVTARYTDTSGPFKYSASAVLRQLEYDAEGSTNTPPANVDDDSAFGWGVALEAAMDVSDAVTLRAGVTHGDGLGGYMNVSPQTSPAYLANNGNLETLESTGGTIGASFKVGPGAINASYNVATVDLDDEEIDGNDTFETAYLNYIWSPAERITYGIEAAWASREEKGGADGDATRIQGMVMYSF